MKIKSHTDNPFNDHADERAKWGAGVLPAKFCPRPRSLATDEALRRADMHVKTHSEQYAPPVVPFELAQVGIEEAQSALVGVGHGIIAHLKEFVGPKVPTRPYISVQTLHLQAARDDAYRVLHLL